MQDKIRINGDDIYQPDEGLKYATETTYTSDSARTQDGVGHFTPMFTVEQLGYTATHIPAKEAANILQKIATGHNFNLHYYSPYYGTWRDALFYVGKGDCNIGSLEENGEYMSSLTFNMTGVHPIA